MATSGKRRPSQRQIQFAANVICLAGPSCLEMVRMKSYKLLGTLMSLLLLVPVCFAQGSYNHAEVGVFLNYTRLSSASDTNLGSS